MLTTSVKEDLKSLSEQYLSSAISQREFEQAEMQAKRKLARIIEREGDADGERRKPYYLAQLIAEAVRSDRFSSLTFELGNFIRCAEENRKQIQQRKKKCPQPKPQGKSKSVSLLYHKNFENAIGGCKNV